MISHRYQSFTPELIGYKLNNIPVGNKYSHRNKSNIYFSGLILNLLAPILWQNLKRYLLIVPE